MLSSYREQAKEALRNGDLSSFIYYVNKGVDMKAEKSTFLVSAIVYGKIDIIKYLVEKHNVDLNEKGILALDNAVINGHLDIVKYLIDQGADPRWDDDSVLMTATSSGRLDIVRYLVEECGANPASLTPYTMRLLEQKTDPLIYNYLNSRMTLEYILAKSSALGQKDFDDVTLEDIRNRKKTSIRFDGNDIKLSGISLMIISKKFDQLMTLYFLTDATSEISNDLSEDVAFGIRNIDLLKSTGQISDLFNYKVWKGKNLKTVEDIYRKLPKQYKDDFKIPFRNLKRKMISDKVNESLHRPEIRRRVLKPS
jgi:ankyrin repeat protein